MPARLICTYDQACFVLWHVYVDGKSQAQAANAVGLSSGTVSRIVNGAKFPQAHPIEPKH